MLKNKKILFILMLAMVLFLIPNICHATVEYTRNFPSNDGTIELNITGLALSSNKQYEYALVSRGGEPKDWFSVTNYNDTTVKITLSSGTTKIVDVLKQTDNGQIFIREKAQEGYVLDRLNVDLKLPYLQSLMYSEDNDKEYYVGSQLYNAIGDKAFNPCTYIKWSKVSDEAFITKFLEIKNNHKNVIALEKDLPSCPVSGYTKESKADFTKKNDGLYLLWVKRTGDNCKEVYSCIIHDGLPKAKTVAEYTGVVAGAPTIDKVQASGGSLEPVGNAVGGDLTNEYHPKVGEKVTINITFNQDIVLKEKPTLTIKFGNGENIELTDVTATSNKLNYTYTIKNGDNGTLQINSLTGGSVTNNEGTAAIYTLPAYSGYKVVAVASRNGQTNSQNQGQTGGSTTQNQNTGSQGGSGSTQKPSNSGTSNNDKDTTIKKDSKFPQTGAAMLSVLLIFVIVIAIISKRKVNQYKDI